ncbi:MAG TPA: ABC transporter permease [Planctomycetota bacterium]|nr:ABC transporter permease [Planctomycetota bacterium]
MKPITNRALKVLLRHRAAMGALAVLILLCLLALGIGIVSRHSPAEMNSDKILKTPSGSHWLGTDELGRDIFARIGYGGRVSLAIGLAAVALAMVVGVPLGAIAGFFGGRTDFAISRILDVLLGIPSILLAILMAAAMQRGLGTLILAVGIVGIPQFARQVRGSVLSLREQDFVQASRALGASPLRTLWREVLPNALGPIIVLATLGVGSAVLTAAGLSFLGLGVETGTPEWGEMLREGRVAFRSSTHLAIFAGLAITLTVLAINIFGDGLRDALDPKAEKKA